MNDKKKHTFVFNKNENGDNAFYLATELTRTPSGVVMNQKIVLRSHCNDATFNLFDSGLTPELLRQLADELEREMKDLSRDLSLEEASKALRVKLGGGNAFSIGVGDEKLVVYWHHSPFNRKSLESQNKEFHGYPVEFRWCGEFKIGGDT